jgi:probable rRNA maturation factor
MLADTKVRFYSADRRIPVLNRKLLKGFIESIFKKEGKPLARLGFIFCSDKYLLKINSKFLKHDEYTDIITFYYSIRPAIESEVYISIDRIRENAIRLGESIQTECLRVMFHGSLHLCGYKDKTATNVKLMRKKEDEYLLKWKRLVSRETN